MSGKLLVANAWKFDTHPARVAHVGRSIEFLWVTFDQSFLNPYSSGNNNCDVTVVMVIDRAHREDFLLHEERRLAVGDLFPRLRQSETETPNAFDVFLFSGRAKMASDD